MRVSQYYLDIHTPFHCVARKLELSIQKPHETTVVERVYRLDNLLRRQLICPAAVYAYCRNCSFCRSNV